MKKLYKFEINREIETEEPQISKNDKGEEIKVLTKVKKQVPESYFIAIPIRKVKEEGEFYHASIVSECLKKGILSATSLQRRFLDDGGILSETQKKNYNEQYEKLFEKQAQHKQLINKDNKTDEDKKQIGLVFNDIINILTTIQNFESQASTTLYQNTAENIARNRATLWWMLHLSYQDKDGKNIPVFGEGSYEEKLKKYDLIELNDIPFEIKLVTKLLLVTSLWYFGKAETQEDFDILIKMNENRDTIEGLSMLEKPKDNQLEMALEK